ncbi:MAG: aspartate/glutamate racemase family protein [Burkholderiaceae bacterium]
MRLLVLNANTSEFVTHKVAAQARLAAAADTEIVPVTCSFGARVITTRSELAIAEHATLDALAQHADACDAVLLAVSYDTALLAAREMLTIPVVGITEAALLTACMLGTRTGVIIFGKRVLPLYQEAALSRGLASRIAGWRALESQAPYADGDQTDVDELVVGAALDLIERDGCEVLVLAGAVMAGVPRRLQTRIPVPVVEGVSCGVAQAELLVRLGCPKAATGSLAPLPTREVIGVSPALRARFCPRP